MSTEGLKVEAQKTDEEFDALLKRLRKNPTQEEYDKIVGEILSKKLQLEIDAIVLQKLRGVVNESCKNY